MKVFDINVDVDERRRYPRCKIHEPVKLLKGDGKYDGIATNLSVGGAAIKLDVILDESFETGDSVTLLIMGLGRIPASVVRLDPNGIAVEFHVDHVDEKKIDVMLMRLFNHMPLGGFEGH